MVKDSLIERTRVAIDRTRAWSSREERPWSKVMIKETVSVEERGKEERKQTNEY